METEPGLKVLIFVSFGEYGLDLKPRVDDELTRDIIKEAVQIWLSGIDIKQYHCYTKLSRLQDR